MWFFNKLVNVDYGWPCPYPIFPYILISLSLFPSLYHLLYAPLSLPLTLYLSLSLSTSILSLHLPLSLSSPFSPISLLHRCCNINVEKMFKCHHIQICFKVNRIYHNLVDFHIFTFYYKLLNLKLLIFFDI